jgi:hypothetical protein
MAGASSPTAARGSIRHARRLGEATFAKRASTDTVVAPANVSLRLGRIAASATI